MTKTNSSRRRGTSGYTRNNIEQLSRGIQAYAWVCRQSAPRLPHPRFLPAFQGVARLTRLFPRRLPSTSLSNQHREFRKGETLSKWHKMIKGLRFVRLTRLFPRRSPSTSLGNQHREFRKGETLSKWHKMIKGLVVRTSLALRKSLRACICIV